MNPISGLSFYDALSKLSIGILLTWWVVPFIICDKCACECLCCNCCASYLDSIKIALYVIFAFVSGCIWQVLESFWKSFVNVILTSKSFLRCVLRVSYDLKAWFVDLAIFISGKSRNNKRFLRREYKIVYKKDIVGNIENKYLKAYYRLAGKGQLGNVPVLEALEAFFRYLVVVLPLNMVTFYVVGNNPLYNFINNFLGEWSCNLTVVLLSLFVFVLLFCFWRIVQMKIFFLVWEADRYYH